MADKEVDSYGMPIPSKLFPEGEMTKKASIEKQIQKEVDRITAPDPAPEFLGFSVTVRISAEELNGGWLGAAGDLVAFTDRIQDQWEFAVECHY